jgi:DNA invertase Pin-like site-specific DNA recombinase
MNIGYALVSTDDRNPDRQLTALKRAGCERIFTGKAAGANVKRPELTRCVKSLAKGGGYDAAAKFLNVSRRTLYRMLQE